MKKIRNLLLVLLVVAICGMSFALAACSRKNDESQHTHSYSSQWTYDENYHWHKATCEHTDEINGRAAHSFNGNVCSVCNYEKSGSDNPQKVFKTVTFNLNGGNGSLDDMQFAVGEVMTTLPSPTRDGYTFICWEIPFIGEEYTAASVMPNRDLQLTARWEKILSGYSDNFVSFKPSSEGVKDALIKEMYRGEVDKFVYVEITSDDLGGIDNVGKQNNFNLRTLEGMQYSVKSGYTWAWYQGNFDTPNGAQRFTLRYGSNIQFVTISDNSGVVQQTYLLDIYVKHDYYISLYKNIFEQEPYDRVRVIENDRFSADTKISESSNFEFDSRVYFNTEKRTYEKFVYSTAITKNWDLYQTYKPITIEAELNEGVIDEDLIITPYTQYFTLPSPEKAGYDFLGWQLANGEYLTNVQGYSGTNYISEENNPEKLTAIYAKKKYYYTFENDTLNTYKTVPIVTYTDKTMRTILDIEYTPYNTYCVVPVKTAQGNNEIFTEWLYYYLSDKGEFSTNLSAFDFDKKIVSPIALAPNTSTTNDYVVPLNGELTSRETGNYRMYLPANKRYQLIISSTSSVTLTINQYGSTSNSRTLTVRSGSPQTVNLDYYIYNLGSTVYSHGYVTFKVTSLNGSFTAKLVGSTAETSGTPVVTNENNTANVGEDFTVPLVKPGYAFYGWYENDTKISENEFITTQDREMEVTAKWVVCPITLEKSIAEAGTVSGVSGTTAIGEEVTITAATKNGYTWVGWYNGDTLLTKELEYTFTMPSEHATYTAKWIKITVDRNLTSAGSVSNLSKTYTVGDEATITATTSNGYTFVGWYNGNVELTNELSYTFKMPAESATYTAKWAKLTLARNNSSAGTISTLNSKYTAGQEVTITANTYSGYTFLGWYNGDTLLSTNANYTFEMPAESVTYTATWTSYTLTTARNDNSAGTVTTKNAVKTTAGQEVTITASTNSGYTFLGWYNGDTLLSPNANYTFDMPAENVTYTAKWTSYTLTTARNDNSAGTVTTKNAVKTTAGQEVTITASTNSGYTFLGWYNGDTLLSPNANYTFEMPAESVTYTAKWTSYTLTVVNTTGGKVNPSAKNQATIAFNLNGASGTAPASQIITKANALQYPTLPTRSGYVFAGWYANSACSGLPFDFSATITEDTVLYAKWIAYSGAGIISINSNKTVSVVKKDSSNKSYYAFVPLVDGTITVYTTGSLDTYGYLYNSGKTQLSTDDDSGDGSNFKITYTVTAGTLYYVSPCGYSSTGNTILYLTGELPQAGGKITGEVSFTEPQKVTTGDSVKLKAVTDDGYTFIGWFDGEDELSRALEYSYNMPAENKVLTAKWMICPVSVINSDSTAGQIQFPLTTIIGEDITLNAIPNNGYTFVGWYNGETLLSTDANYTFNMSTESVAYTAKWTYYTLTTTKNDSDAGTVTTKNAVKTTVGQRVTISATTNNGYTWIGWYNGETLLSTDANYTFNMPAENVTYTAKWTYYTLTTSVNDAEAGTATIKNEVKTTADQEVTITANTNDGYTFLGWYNGETLLSTNANYTFNMPAENVTYTAKWTSYTITTAISDVKAGDITKMSAVKTTSGKEVTITITVNKGYEFSGWYEGDQIVSSNLSYTFAMPSKNITYTAKLLVKSDMSNYLFTSTPTTLNITGVKDYSLETLVVPNYVDTISKGAFSGCNKLKSIILPFIGGDNSVSSASATTLFGYIFGENEYEGGQQIVQKYSSSGSKTYYVPTTLKNITVTGGKVLYGAFYNCNMVENINVPSTITSIGNYAFVGCSSLQHFVVPDTISSLSLGLFSGCGSLESLTIPFVGGNRTASSASSSTVLGYIFGASEYDGGEVIRQAYAPTTETTGFVDYCIPRTLKNVTVTGGKILYGAFSYCSNIEYINLPNSITSIGEFVFYGCSSLLSIEIPNSVTEIGKNAFSRCENLVSVTLPNNLTKINDSTFIFCSRLASIVIPNKVTSIGEYAFAYCHDLKSITIPKSVTSFGSQAFFSGPGTGDVYYLGSLANWCGITFNSYSEANPVSRMHNLYINGELLTELEIPSSITTIKSFAFNGCSNLKSVVLHSNVKTIYTDAFRNCYNLIEVYNYSSLNITKGSTGNGYVGYYALGIYDAQGEESKFKITEDGLKFYVNGDECYLIEYLGNESILVLPETVEGKKYEIHDYAFSGCSQLVSITLPNGITTINKNTFANCSSLTSVTLPESVILINDYAFYNCINLTTINMPEGVSRIGVYAFGNCRKLTSIVIPEGIVTADGIGNNAFYGCYLLAEVYNLSSISIAIGGNGRGYAGYYAIAIKTTLSEESDIITQDNYIFYVGDELCYLVGYIGEETTLMLPETINGRNYNIKNYAFATLSFINKIIIPSGVKEIGEGAFSYCDNLKEIVLPETIQIIRGDAFENCTSLTKVNYMGDISTWCKISFYQSGRATYYANPLSIAHSLYLNSNLVTQIEIPSSISQIRSATFYGWSELKSIIIPESVTSIGSNAFYGCSGLKSIIIPESVTSIGSNAFYGCSGLKSVIIPEGITSIGFYAFGNCSNLTNISIPNSIASIESYAFNGCNKLQYNTYNNAYYLGNESNPYLVLVKAQNTSISSCTINSSTKFILGRAFYNCSKLTTISIPYSVTFIGSDAFRESGLTSATFSNKSGWKASSTSLTLSNSTNNATYLVSTYAYCDWKRS